MSDTVKALTDGQILKLIDARMKLQLAKADATRAIRTQLVELQAKLNELAAPFDAKLDKIDGAVKQSILARGNADGLVTDVRIIYVSGYDKRGVDLDGLWGLQDTAPKLWEKVEKFTKITHVAPRVDIRD